MPRPQKHVCTECAVLNKLMHLHHQITPARSPLIPQQSKSQQRSEVTFFDAAEHSWDLAIMLKHLPGYLTCLTINIAWGTKIT